MVLAVHSREQRGTRTPLKGHFKILWENGNVRVWCCGIRRGLCYFSQQPHQFPFEFSLLHGLTDTVSAHKYFIQKHSYQRQVRFQSVWICSSLMISDGELLPPPHPLTVSLGHLCIFSISREVSLQVFSLVLN